MRRHCRPEDRNIGDGDSRCGLMFDDEDRSTVCPHPWLSHNVRDRHGWELMLWVAAWCVLAKGLLNEIEVKGAERVILESVTDS